MLKTALADEDIGILLAIQAIERVLTRSQRPDHRHTLQHIVQLSRDESASLLQQLYRHIEKSVHLQVRVHWEPGTLLFWDNWATQHRAIWDYYPEDRWGERVSATLGYGPASAREV